VKELEIEMKNSEIISDFDSCDKPFVYNFLKSKLIHKVEVLDYFNSRKNSNEL
jgi:hypothetical protein